jgi:hypothetical protein
MSNALIPDETKYSHPEFPEVTLRRSTTECRGDTVIELYDPETKQTMRMPAHRLFWQLSCLINNNIANPLAGSGKKELHLFFRRLARDIDSLGTLLTAPENCSGACKGNLAHFHRRALGNSRGW